MKIATWNVNSGTISDRLVELRSTYDADIVAMQETAEPNGTTSGHWDGDLKHKGISLSSNLTCERAHVEGESSPAIAARIDDSRLGRFNVLALWAKPTPSYFADLTRTIELYTQFIRESPTVILGDFNMSARIRSTSRQFDLLNGKLNHDFGVYSAYHELTNERFGMETMTTLYYQ